MLARIELEYTCRAKIAALSAEEYAELAAVIDDFPPAGSESFLYASQFFVDLNAAGPVLSKFRIDFTVRRFKGQVFLGGPVPTLAGQPVHVHIPNVGLLSVSEVTWLENCCTQELQSYLDKGWRILAVCPPNCQRRPDYILGRAKEDRA